MLLPISSQGIIGGETPDHLENCLCFDPLGREEYQWGIMTACGCSCECEMISQEPEMEMDTSNIASKGTTLDKISTATLSTGANARPYHAYLYAILIVSLISLVYLLKKFIWDNR